MQRSVLLVLAACLAGAGTVVAQTTTKPASRPAATRLDVQVNPFVDLHFFVRACAAGAATAPEIDEFEEAVRAAGELDRSLGGPLAWGFIEAVLSACTSAVEAREACPSGSGRDAGASWS
ncbi:MAG: hypothetical protein ACYS0G_08145 [Planctomycetota bacterium]|jgi:hypothetical protein